MHIFYAAPDTPNFEFKSNLWNINLCLPLQDMGHEVTKFKYDLEKVFHIYFNSDANKRKILIEKSRKELGEELLRQVKEAHSYKKLDLLLSYFYDLHILPEAIDEIQAMGITTVNWYCNGSYQLNLVSEISPHYDWCLVPEKFRLQDYIAMGAKPIYCQEAANPNIYKPYDLSKEFDVTFVGQAYGDRPQYIRYLLDRGIDVRVWGYGWQNFSPETKTAMQAISWERALYIGKRLLTPQGWQAVGQSFQKMLSSPSGEQDSFSTTVALPPEILGSTLSDLEMIQMYSRSKINLGFSTCGNTHLTDQRILQVRLRDFEVPMSGGFYMVEYMEELEEFFEIGKEIVCYTDPEDLADKIRYYLAHDEERERIRLAGMQRARSEHTWHKRFEMAFQQMGLS